MSLPAPLVRATLAQTGMELRLTARRGENLLAMLGIPAALLLFFGSTEILPAPASGSSVHALLPGMLALAIVATGLVNLGIATAYERSYGVLKRLGGSPLGRTGLVVAKVAAVLVIEVLLLVLLIALAASFLGWRPAAVSWPLLLAAVGLGTAVFAGAGLALAGALRAEATLLLANVLFVLTLGLGGVIVPIADLPGPIGLIAGILPAAALSESLRVALGAAGEVRAVIILAVWAVVAVVLAARTFRWD